MSDTLGNDIIRHQLERLARRERGRLVADIVSRIGPQRLQLAEDVVQGCGGGGHGELALQGVAR